MCWRSSHDAKHCMQQGPGFPRSWPGPLIRAPFTTLVQHVQRFAACATRRLSCWRASFSARALLLTLTYFDIGKYAATNRWHACGAQEKPGSYGRRSCRVSLNCVARNLRRARPAVPHHSCDTACASCVALSNYSAAIARVNYSYLMNLSRVNAKPSPLTNCY